MRKGSPPEFPTIQAPSMTTTESSSNKSLLSKFVTLCRWLLKGLVFLGKAVLVLWATLAIYFSNLPWAWARMAMAVAFFAFGVWALWWSRRLKTYLLFAGLYSVVVIWFILIPPRQDRNWRPEVAKVSRAYIDGDNVRITNVRNFQYRSADDFTVHYEDRDVQLSHLTGVEFFISYWMPGPVAHTFLSFNFDNAPPISISIETRPQVGEGFDPLASMFKQFELIYIVGDERDIVGVRTDHRNEDVFMYHIRMTPEQARELFLVYLNRINQLADRPEFYHLLSDNCTLNIIRYARKVGKPDYFDIRYWLNGFSDRGLYRAGYIATYLPFAELRRRSWINSAAREAGGAAEFYQRIRDAVPRLER
jgi:hypothetical protein